MVTADPSKQTNVRLPLSYHEQLQRAAQQQGKPVGTLARELLMSALDGSDLSAANTAASSVDTEAMMERLDSIEDSIKGVSTVHHIALRAILKPLLEDPLEAQSMSKMLDAIIGPMPAANRT